MCKIVYFLYNNKKCVFWIYKIVYIFYYKLCALNAQNWKFVYVKWTIELCSFFKKLDTLKV